MKFATKFVLQYPPHLRHVATLPWEIKSHIFCRYSADMVYIEFKGGNFLRHSIEWLQPCQVFCRVYTAADDEAKTYKSTKQIFSVTTIINELGLSA